MSGWIKLHRKTIDSPIFKKPEAMLLWVYLLLKANHADADVLIGNQLFHVKRGQSLTGRKSLSVQTGLSESKVERLLKLLEIGQQIEQQTFSNCRLISIVNYDLYQGDEQQTNNIRTAFGQHSDTNKNDKNEKKKDADAFVPPTFIDLVNYAVAKKLDPAIADREAKLFLSYYQSNGWKVGKNKMVNWKSAFSGWITRSKKYAGNQQNKPEQINWDATGWSEGIGEQ